MNSKKVEIICFSPTKSTKKILETIALGISTQTAKILDLTLPSALPDGDMEISSELALIGIPVYSGRVPLVAVERLQKLRAEGVPAAIVVVYGNRGYDDALIELHDIAVKSGFKPIAAGAFIAEHSFSVSEYPIAKSRPDLDDLERARTFGEKIAKQMTTGNLSNMQSVLKLPGTFPYKERGKSAGISPETDKSICNLCKKCIEVCPTNAISEFDGSTDSELCILCGACVKVCVSDARKTNHPAFTDIAKRLSTNFQLRLEPETFI